MQRALLCRAVISDPKLLILDEPANFVDNRFENELYRMLAELHGRMAIVMISHDLGTITSVVRNIVSVGACNMFSDYLLGDESTATITANEDGTINLVYKSGSGDFTLNNLKLSSNKSFSGSGEVAMSMGGSTGGSYDYTLEGSVDGSKVLSLKANVDIPVPMGKMEIDFIQGETPVGYYIKDTYKYQTNLSLKVQGGEVGSTTDCQVKIENPTGSTVNVTISGRSAHFRVVRGGILPVSWYFRGV